MIRIDGTTGDVRTNVGRRLAERHTSGDMGTDQEDSPLQSKRSSMLPKKLKNLIVSCFCCCCCFVSIN